ncbi:MAG: oligosaccharide repeat unit polymerase [Acidobacteriia bacterium]|nr:oligosaccharide repeat unit polymerase [Terriglobia bacterium]
MIVPATVALAGAAVLSGFFQGEETQLAALAAVIIGVMTPCLWLVKAEASLDFFEFPVMLYGLLVVFFPLRLILAVLLGEELFYLPPAALRLSLLACLTGFLAFAVGYRSKAGMRLAERFNPLISRFDGEWDVGRTNLLALALMIVSLISVYLVYSATGSLFYFLRLDPLTKNPYEIAYWYYYATWGIKCLAVGALFQAVIFLRYRQQPLLTAGYFLAAALTAALVSRGTLIMLLLLVFGLFNYLRRKVGPVLLAWLGVLVLAWLVLGGMLRYRASLAFTPTGVSDLLRLHVLQGLDHLPTLAIVMQNVPDVLPWQRGKTFLVLLYKPIPRSVMPDKPLGASGILNSTLFPLSYEAGYAFSSTIIGEWYLNFSWAGIILGMALIGVAASMVWHLRAKSRSPGRVLIYLVCVFGLVSWVRNDFQVATTDFFFLLLPTLAGVLFARRPERYRKRLLVGGGHFLI